MEKQRRLANQLGGVFKLVEELERTSRLRSVFACRCRLSCKARAAKPTIHATSAASAPNSKSVSRRAALLQRA